MGLDAFVRCNCFEEGKCTPPPKPFLSSDVYRDEEGYLCSRMLDGLRKKYDRRQFEARFLDLDRTFETWTDNSCEHEYGEYCSEWISNWAGVSEFQCLVGEINELTPLPLLSKIMPDGNGGSYPARLAHATLKELNTFTEHLGSVSMWALVSTKSNEPVWTCFEGSHFTWMFSPTKTVAMEGAEIIFRSKGCEIRTKRFLQIPRGTASDKEQPVEIICKDTGARFELWDSIGSPRSSNAKQEFWTEKRQAPFLSDDGRYGVAERLRHLLVASEETGNPIEWC